MKKLIGYLLMSLMLVSNINISAAELDSTKESTYIDDVKEFEKNNPHATFEDVIKYKETELNMTRAGKAVVRVNVVEVDGEQVPYYEIVEAEGRTAKNLADMYEKLNKKLDKTKLEKVKKAIKNEASNQVSIMSGQSENSDGVLTLYIHDTPTHEVGISVGFEWDSPMMNSPYDDLTMDVFQITWDNDDLVASETYARTYDMWGDITSGITQIDAKLGGAVWDVSDQAARTSVDIAFQPTSDDVYGNNTQINAQYTHTYGTPLPITVGWNGELFEVGIKIGTFKWDLATFDDTTI